MTLSITLCAHNSSLISLAANRVLNPHHNDIESDKEIIKRGMKNIEDLAKQTGSEKLRYIRDTLDRLCSYADMISFRNTTPSQLPPSLDILDGESQHTFLEPPESQYLANDVLIPDFDPYWAPLSYDRV